MVPSRPSCEGGVPVIDISQVSYGSPLTRRRFSLFDRTDDEDDGCMVVWRTAPDSGGGVAAAERGSSKKTVSHGLVVATHQAQSRGRATLTS